jgi:hypothetical protein
MLLATSLIFSGSGPGAGMGFNPSPDANQLPGFSVLQKLTDGIEGWALIAALVGVVIGAIVWASSRRLTRRKSQVR